MSQPILQKDRAEGKCFSTEEEPTLQCVFQCRVPLSALRLCNLSNAFFNQSGVSSVKHR